MKKFKNALMGIIVFNYFVLLVGYAQEDEKFPIQEVILRNSRPNPGEELDFVIRVSNGSVGLQEYFEIDTSWLSKKEQGIKQDMAFRGRIIEPLYSNVYHVKGIILSPTVVDRPTFF